jgi:hypothetical protein
MINIRALSMVPSILMSSRNPDRFKPHIAQLFLGVLRSSTRIISLEQLETSFPSE